MRRAYSRLEVEKFLRLIDAELRRPCTVVLLGGTAAGLTCGSDCSTSTLELWTASDIVFWTAAERAGEQIARPIPVEQAHLGEPPYHFEERLRTLSIEGLKHLTVLVPEAHDLVLLEAAQARSLATTAEVHRTSPLSLPTLTARYHEMKRQVSGPKSRFRSSFLAAVTRLFGSADALQVEKSLG